MAECGNQGLRIIIQKARGSSILKYRNISQNIRFRKWFNGIYNEGDYLTVNPALNSVSFCTTSRLFMTLQTHKYGALEPLFYGQSVLCIIFVELTAAGGGVTNK